MTTVFHVAAKAGVWGPYSEYFDINVSGTRHVLNACRKGESTRLIYTSSPSVVFDGRDMKGTDESAPYPSSYPCAYPETKALAEQRVRAAARHLGGGPEDAGAIHQPGFPQRGLESRQHLCQLGGFLVEGFVRDARVTQLDEIVAWIHGNVTPRSLEA